MEPFVLLKVSMRDEEPAVTRRQFLGVGTGLGSQLALFEALNIQKSKASMLHVWR
jgi:hypothetical protein